jgi:hypothetical protein
MTTNITPIEALKKILQEPCPLDDLDVNKYFEDTSIKPCKDICPLYGNGKCPYTIAKQALAPQECDVTKCDFYNKIQSCERCELGSVIYKGKSNYKYHIDCRQNPNCYYKQLHSQQKTFTLEEIREILEDYYGGNEKGIFPLMHEFEKAVDR